MTNLETHISKSNVKDQIAAFLSASGLIHDYEDVVSIDFKKLTDDESDLIPIIIKTKKREVYDEEALDGYHDPSLDGSVEPRTSPD